MAGKELLESYTPKRTYGGSFPIITDSGKVKSGETITEMMPVALDESGTFVAVTSSTIANTYGIAASDAEGDEEVVVYLTGEFFGDAIVAPSGTTASDFKAVLRKQSIFLIDTENTVTSAD